MPDQFSKKEFCFELVCPGQKSYIVSAILMLLHFFLFYRACFTKCIDNFSSRTDSTKELVVSIPVYFSPAFLKLK